MNLFQSVIMSFFVILIFWGLAALQPNFALASESNEVGLEKSKGGLLLKSNEKTLTKPVGSSTDLPGAEVQISGVSQYIVLNEVSTLWDEFNHHEVLQNSLKKNPTKVYVLYRDFTRTYEKATVTIGYNSQDVKLQINNIYLPSKKLSPLLTKGKYTEAQLRLAWEKIDYRKRVVNVLEIYDLDSDNLISSSEIFVSYE